ncbi:MAG: EamA family transporter [Proteobacteria bacterium]|nr:EamA family transporter [Pseudomonadota bacterium]MBI3498355.1 EamA family transporter [Pseudomonadota bacterium]
MELSYFLPRLPGQSMKLDPTVVGLVLLAAVMHASWNAVVKSDSDRLVSMGLVMATGSVIGLFAFPFVAIPDRAAWPYLVGSVTIHAGYYFALLRAYAHGDLSHVYPIARGLGPLLVAMFAGRLVHEELSWSEAAGVALVSLGIASLAFARGTSWRADWRGTAFAVLTGFTIAGYTVVDGIGGRSAGDVFSYIVWLNILEGPWVIAVALFFRGRALLPYLRRHWRRGVAGGIIATLGYAIAIWALSVGAMAHVAALRETSVLFAAVLGTRLLGERFGLRRVVAAGVVVAGLLLMNLSLGR